MLARLRARRQRGLGPDDGVGAVFRLSPEEVLRLTKILNDLDIAHLGMRQWFEARQQRPDNLHLRYFGAAFALRELLAQPLAQLVEEHDETARPASKFTATHANARRYATVRPETAGHRR